MAQTKINFLNGSLFTRYASNATDASRYLTNNIVEVVNDFMISEPESGFVGVVVSGIQTGQNNGSSQYTVDAEVVKRTFIFNGISNTNEHLGVFVRPVNRQSALAPDPMKSSNQGEKNWIIGMQEFAISDKPLKFLNSIQAGAQVNCYYASAPEMGFPERTLFFRAGDVTPDSFVSYISQGFKAVTNLANSFTNSQSITTVNDFASVSVNIPPQWNGALPTIPQAVVTSTFGPRRAPVPGASTQHGGLDLAGGAPNGGRGTPIYAVNGGKVVIAGGPFGGAGIMVKIEHPGGWITRYLHLNEVLVKKGANVTRGQQIGTMGNTGIGTGAHLHFEVAKDGTKLDPLLVFGWPYKFAKSTTEKKYRERLRSAGIYQESPPAPPPDDPYPPESSADDLFPPESLPE